MIRLFRSFYELSRLLRAELEFAGVPSLSLIATQYKGPRAFVPALRVKLAS